MTEVLIAQRDLQASRSALAVAIQRWNRSKAGVWFSRPEESATRPLRDASLQLCDAPGHRLAIAGNGDAPAGAGQAMACPLRIAHVISVTCLLRSPA